MVLLIHILLTSSFGRFDIKVVGKYMEIMVEVVGTWVRYGLDLVNFFFDNWVFGPVYAHLD